MQSIKYLIRLEIIIMLMLYFVFDGYTINIKWLYYNKSIIFGKVFINSSLHNYYINGKSQLPVYMIVHEAFFTLDLKNLELL